MSDRLVSGAELARILGLTSRRIRQLRDDGTLPADGRRYPLAACVQAYVAFRVAAAAPAGVSDARARLMALRAEALELDLRERRGELCFVADAIGAWEMSLSNFALELDGLPHGIADELAHKDRDTVCRLLTDRLNAARTRVADKPDVILKKIQGYGS